jgi:hypothetical protein
MFLSLDKHKQFFTVLISFFLSFLEITLIMIAREGWQKQAKTTGLRQHTNRDQGEMPTPPPHTSPHPTRRFGKNISQKVCSSTLYFLLLIFHHHHHQGSKFDCLGALQSFRLLLLQPSRFLSPRHKKWLTAL